MLDYDCLDNVCPVSYTELWIPATRTRADISTLQIPPAFNPPGYAMYCPNEQIFEWSNPWLPKYTNGRIEYAVALSNAYTVANEIPTLEEFTRPVVLLVEAKRLGSLNDDNQAQMLAELVTARLTNLRNAALTRRNNGKFESGSVHGVLTDGNVFHFYRLPPNYEWLTQAGPDQIVYDPVPCVGNQRWIRYVQYEYAGPLYYDTDLDKILLRLHIIMEQVANSDRNPSQP